MGKLDAKDRDTVGMIIEPKCLVVYYIFNPLLSFIFVPCSTIFSVVHFFLKKRKHFFLILRVLYVYSEFSRSVLSKSFIIRFNGNEMMWPSLYSMNFSLKSYHNKRQNQKEMSYQPIKDTEETLHYIT